MMLEKTVKQAVKKRLKELGAYQLLAGADWHGRDRALDCHGCL